MRHYQSICSAANVKPSPHLPCNTIILSYVAWYPNLRYSSISRTCASTETHWTIDPASSQGYVLIKANRPPILLLISRLPQELWTLPFVIFFFKVASDCNTFVTIWLFIYFSFQSSVGLQYGSTTMNKYKYFSFSTNQRAKFPIFNLNLYIYLLHLIWTFYVNIGR